jgi:nitronate monooxygenase
VAASLLAALGVARPVFAAPMAGGASTPALVTAAARSGGLGFLAAGYKTPDAFAADLAAVAQAGVPFGVSLFAPNPVPVSPGEFRGYAATIQVEADRYGISLDGATPVEDDDWWPEKLDILQASPVPAVSFTFGIPAPDVIRALRATGALLIQTVTSAAEARRAADAGVDALAVQASVAGGHSGTLTPLEPLAALPLTDLIAGVRRAVDLPLIAAGGLATAADVAAAIRAGADAVAVGTVLLRADEAGTSAVHRAALADPARAGTVLTRAFTGRPARGLRNDFTERYSAVAPSGYPALHHLTSPIRRAAAAAGDPENVNVWAGAGYRAITATPAAEILASLAP